MNRKVLIFAAIGILAALSFGSPLGATPAAKKAIRVATSRVGSTRGARDAPMTT